MIKKRIQHIYDFNRTLWPLPLLKENKKFTVRLVMRFNYMKMSYLKDVNGETIDWCISCVDIVNSLVINHD